MSNISRSVVLDKAEMEAVLSRLGEQKGEEMSLGDLCSLSFSLEEKPKEYEGEKQMITLSFDSQGKGLEPLDLPEVIEDICSNQLDEYYKVLQAYSGENEERSSEALVVPLASQPEPSSFVKAPVVEEVEKTKSRKKRKKSVPEDEDFVPLVKKKRAYYRKSEHSKEFLEKVEAQRLAKKRLKNRELAARSRLKKKEKMLQLETENSRLKDENQNLKRKLAQAQARVLSLQEQVGTSFDI